MRITTKLAAAASIAVAGTLTFAAPAGATYCDIEQQVLPLPVRTMGEPPELTVGVSPGTYPVVCVELEDVAGEGYYEQGAGLGGAGVSTFTYTPGGYYHSQVSFGLLVCGEVGRLYYDVEHGANISGSQCI